MSDSAVIVKTRKFKRNPLLSRRQVRFPLYTPEAQELTLLRPIARQFELPHSRVHLLASAQWWDKNAARDSKISPFTSRSSLDERGAPGTDIPPAPMSTHVYSYYDASKCTFIWLKLRIFLPYCTCLEKKEKQHMIQKFRRLPVGVRLTNAARLELTFLQRRCRHTFIVTMMLLV